MIEDHGRLKAPTNTMETFTLIDSLDITAFRYRLVVDIVIGSVFLIMVIIKLLRLGNEPEK